MEKTCDECGDEIAGQTWGSIMDERMEFCREKCVQEWEERQREFEANPTTWSR